MLRYVTRPEYFFNKITVHCYFTKDTHSCRLSGKKKKTCSRPYRELDSQLAENLKPMGGRVGQVGDGEYNKNTLPATGHMT